MSSSSILDQIQPIQHPPTPEQQAILQAVRDSSTSLMVTALAGTGKTTTLTMIAQSTESGQAALALAFNVSTKKALEAAFPSHFTVMTMNGLGMRAWMRAIPGKRIVVDDRKLGRLVSKVCKGQGFDATSDQWSGIRELVSAGMLAGIVPQGYPNKGLADDSLSNWGDLADAMMTPMGEVEIEIARAVLKLSVVEAFEGTISFDDQLYMPTLFNGVFPRFMLVLIDEAQDLNQLQHIMARRVAAGRLIIVGDPLQSIYAFRGADTKSMAKLKALRAEWIELPLHTTFRCPKIVVERQQKHAPEFTAFHSNKVGGFARLFGGTIDEYGMETDKGSSPWFAELRASKLERIRAKGQDYWEWSTVERLVGTQTLAVLCRNNAPLLGMAFKLLAQGVPVTMLGRDIGKGLIALSRKVLPDDGMDAGACIAAVNEWRESEIAVARANGKDGKVEGVHDRAECLLAVIEAGRARTAKEVRQFLEQLFSRTSGQVVLSTIHRAKGLEWDVVLHLDSWRLPSKYAIQNPAQMQQELNLKYVCETRAKNVLLEANLAQFGETLA